MPYELLSETPETRATEQLKREQPRHWRQRYKANDASGALRSAAKTAINTNRDAFVVSSNRYGMHAWVVTSNMSDVLSISVNSGRMAFRVKPNREISRLCVGIRDV